MMLISIERQVFQRNLNWYVYKKIDICYEKLFITVKNISHPNDAIAPIDSPVNYYWIDSERVSIKSLFTNVSNNV